MHATFHAFNQVSSSTCTFNFHNCNIYCLQLQKQVWHHLNILLILSSKILLLMSSTLLYSLQFCKVLLCNFNHNSCFHHVSLALHALLHYQHTIHHGNQTKPSILPSRILNFLLCQPSIIYELHVPWSSL